MPFAGSFNKYNKSTPGSHAPSDSMGDWATDIYAAPGTAVLPRIYAPINGSTYQLKVISTWTGCAGRGVRVGVYQNGTLRGSVSYAHLDAVPAFSPGQVVTTGTVLGKLRLWPPCPAWVVKDSAGVHTHIEVGTASGTACYSYQTATTLPDTRRIGKISPASNPASPCV